VASSLAGNPPTPALLLLGESTEIPTGVGSGIDEIALKPLPADALVYRLQALLIRTGRHLPMESNGWADEDAMASGAIGEGHVVSVFAPKGGVGKTTISVNMAVAIRQQTRAEVLLFDADVGVGNVSSVLDVPYRLGLADLADSAPEDWTDQAFEQAVSTHAETGVKVLTWGTDPAQSEKVTVDLLLAALRWARAHHTYVIVDNHPGYDDRTMAMLAVANEILLVVTPEVGAIRNSSQFLELARELGLGNVIRVVVNRANHGIRMEDMATSLGLPISATVVSNGPKAVIASNEGKPIITKFPKERISDDLHRVAR
jgi:pilus assembly protein CpaE